MPRNGLINQNINHAAENNNYLLYKAEKPSVRLHLWHADNSAVSSSIETLLAQSESCVFEDHRVYFYKYIVPSIHGQEFLEDKGVSSH